MADQSQSPTGSSGCLIRSLWMFGGNGLLAYLIFYVTHNPSRSAVITGFVYAGTVIAMIVVRYVDIRFLNGETAAGEPATIAHWRKYSTVLIVVALVLWIAACVIARNMG